ncbi:MAG: hypothetical protein NT002_00235 [candidate division Zixibacteria bacterium]|nr:hypothetical protein [candidate division Zixibacteria bacterium]
MILYAVSYVKKKNKLVDSKEGSLTSYAELLGRLQSFKKDGGNELPLAPIEKWMCEELGVKRLKNTGGSMVRFEHPAIAELKGDGIFGIHVARGGRREMIYRKNFKTYLCPCLLYIIETMRKEGLCGNERP